MTPDISEKLKKTLNAYHNRAISTMEVIEELIRLAKEMDAATKRGEDLGLTDDEIALTPSLPLSRAMPIGSCCLSRSPAGGSGLYYALAANETAVRAMGDDKLKVIAAELITQVRKSVTIDWTLREGARAKIGSLAVPARSACGLCFAPPVSVAPLLRLA